MADRSNLPGMQLNATLPERFRALDLQRAHRGPLSAQRGPDVKLNADIRAYVQAAEAMPSSKAGRWLKQPEVPTSAEISTVNEGDIAFIPNKVDRPWKAEGKYLEAHYGLLREDAVSPLRDAVAEFRRNPTMMEGDKGVAIYEKVE